MIQYTKFLNRAVESPHRLIGTLQAASLSLRDSNEDIEKLKFKQDKEKVNGDHPEHRNLANWNCPWSFLSLGTN